MLEMGVTMGNGDHDEGHDQQLQQPQKYHPWEPNHVHQLVFSTHFGYVGGVDEYDGENHCQDGRADCQQEHGVVFDEPQDLETLVNKCGKEKKISIQILPFSNLKNCSMISDNSN